MEVGAQLGQFEGPRAVADLVLAVLRRGVPPPPCQAVHAKARELLRPGGLFVTLPVASGASDPVSATVGSAAKAGLEYFQHVVLIDPSSGPGRSGDVAVTGKHINLLTFRRSR